MFFDIEVEVTEDFQMSRKYNPITSIALYDCIEKYFTYCFDPQKRIESYEKVVEFYETEYEMLNKFFKSI